MSTNTSGASISTECCCQNVGINTREYLTDVIGRLQAGFPLRRINDLLPNVWERPSTQVAEAGL